MTWFKVDDKLHDHRKARAAGKAAMGVWVLAGSWAADNLTDGFVPASVLARWGTRADANKLVNVGLWAPDEQDSEKGWRFHQWNDAGRQPTKADRLAQREARAAAGREGGKASGRSRKQASAKQSASPFASDGVEPPSRPVPTTAAAAAVANDAAAAAELPGPIAVLRSKLQAHTALQALRFDSLTTDQTDQLVELIEVQGDQRLVDTVLRTLKTPTPIYVTAFLRTWAAMPKPGDRHLGVVRQRLCDTHSTVLSPSGTCSACISDQKAAR